MASDSVMGTLTVGDAVVVEFAAAAGQGVTIMNTGYVARPSISPSPVVPPVVQVRAGETGLQQTTIAEAFSLVIDVDVPASGGGDLAVRVNGTVRDQETITGDVVWSYVIL
jgi:hypothetical protein